MRPVVYLPPDPDRPGDVHPLAAVGLPDWVDGATPVPVGKGPDEQEGGLLYAWPPARTKVSELEWLSALPTHDRPPDRYYLGLDPNDPPTERDLRRRFRVAGTAVVIDGQAWEVPAIEALPQTFARNAFGQWVSAPAERYANFAAQAAAMRHALAGKRKLTTVGAVLDLSELALQQNYLLTPELISRLGLLTTTPTLREDGKEDSSKFPVLLAAIGTGD
ncbi:hypothetical protein [Alienimonas sp. DA493]|uniref:hypothetical protein n=1 Tax=Alienimonas sp. DA493 TaxID=3373605 RepID=UPI0037544146